MSKGAGIDRETYVAGIAQLDKEARTLTGNAQMVTVRMNEALRSAYMNGTLVQTQINTLREAAGRRT